MRTKSSAPRFSCLLVSAAAFTAFALAASCGDGTNSDSAPSTGGSGGAPSGSNTGGASGGTRTGGAITASGGTGDTGGTGGNTTGGSGGSAGSGGAKTGGTGGSATGASASGGSAGTGSGGLGGAGDQTTPDAGASPTGPAAVQLRGRFDRYDTTPALFGWPGSAMIARFNGTGATIQLNSSDDRYQVVIDGAPTSVIKVTANGKFEVAKGLSSGTHEMVIWRRTESRWSQSSFLGLEITGGQLLAPPTRPDRRIEIYGDSITAGYGVDGVGPSCSVSQDNSNNYAAYGSVAARALSAELHSIAWSGIGMYRGYGETTPAASTMTMPKVFDRIQPGATGVWDFSSWQPHAVVINLGTNDASSNGDPGTPYRTAYLDFVRGLRQKYPSAFFVLSIGPMLDGDNLKAIRTHLQEILKTRASEGDTKMSYLEYPVQVQGDGYGCDWHPSAKTQAKMADLLVAELKKQLSW